MTSSYTAPMRPPRHGGRRIVCPCGRRALYRSRAPRSDGRVRADRTHTLCFACWRRQRDSLFGHRCWYRFVGLPPAEDASAPGQGHPRAAGPALCVAARFAGAPRGAIR